MRNLTKVVLLLAVIVAGISATIAVALKTHGATQKAPATAHTSATPRLPAFPQGENELTELAMSGDKIRSHAWSIFDDLVLQTPRPMWDGWPSKTEALAPISGCNSSPVTGDESANGISPERLRFLKSLSVPRQFIVEGKTPIKSTSPQFAQVIFNRSAADHITSIIKGTNSCTWADALKKELNAPLKSIPDFPKDAIAIKTIWELVPGPFPGETKVPGVHVWDPTQPQLKGSASDQFQDVAFWNSDISIETNGSPCDPAKDYTDGVVPLSCFYSVQLNSDEVQWLHDHHNETGVVFLPGAQSFDGFHLILLGFHVMTSEMLPSWTWQTYFWSNRAFKEDAAKHLGNPANLGQEQWSHYVMDTSLTAPLPTDPVGKIVTFNPYLEGTRTHGTVSNCNSCHQYAVYHTVSQFDTGMAFAQRPLGEVAPAQAVDTYKDTGLATSFLWSLSDINRTLSDKPTVIFVRKRR